MAKQIQWATLGCGVIGNELATIMKHKHTHGLYGVGNRTHAKAVAFAQKYDIPKIYATPEDIFHDDAVDVVYISTPHNTHLPFILHALEHGKHVLAEKSIVLNSGELTKAKALAAQKHLVLAEAMTLYHMPLYQKLEQRIQNGDFGAFRLAQVNFGSYKEYSMQNRFFNRSLAGGAMLDIGVYALSLVRRFMPLPEKALSEVLLAPSDVDESAGIVLKNHENALATITLSLHAKQPKRATLSFDKAYLEIFDYPRAERATIVWTEDGRREEITAGHMQDALLYEVQDMEAAIRGDQARMHLDWTEDVMRLMTNLRQNWGVQYPEEV